MSLKLTRAIIDAIHDDVLDKVPTKVLPIFGLHVPQTCPGVPADILDAKSTWTDKVNTYIYIYNTQSLYIYICRMHMMPHLEH